MKGLNPTAIILVVASVSVSIAFAAWFGLVFQSSWKSSWTTTPIDKIHVN